MKQKKIKWPVRIIVLMSCILLSMSLSAQKKRVSCVGNSITYGYDLPNPSTQGYPGQLQVLLGTTGWEVGNFGDSGRTMLKGGGYSYWDSQRYKDALASNPSVVMIELGTNDSKRWLWDSKGAEFKSDYKAMVQSIQNLPSKPEISFANGKLSAPDGDDYQWYLDGAPVATGNGGKQKEMVVTKTGNYKVSVKLSENNETRIVSKELNVSVLN